MIMQPLLSTILSALALTSPSLPQAMQRIADTGIVVEEMEQKHNLRSFLLTTGTRQQTVYLTPDEEGVIAGILYDKEGQNVTAKQLETHYLSSPRDIQTVDALNQHLSSANTIELANSENAYTLIVYVDPLCPHCQNLIRQLTPAILHKLVNIQVVPVSTLGEKSNNVVKNIMASTDPASAMLEFMLTENIKHNTVHGNYQPMVDENNASFILAGFRSTPGIFLASHKTGDVTKFDGLTNEFLSFLNLLSKIDEK